MQRQRRWCVIMSVIFVWMTIGCGDSTQQQTPEDGSTPSDAVVDGSAHPDADVDPDGGPLCGNGVVDVGETCDSTCPESQTDCPASDLCETVEFTGSGCTAQCVVSPIDTCQSGDGCCPSGCDLSSDDDCPNLCGNGVLEPGENCDANCPASVGDCQNPAVCETVHYTGSAADCSAQCEYDPITLCANGDGCCPTGCDLGTDDDCPNVCGDGVPVGNETCDPPSTCPTQPSDCGPLQACDVATIIGDAALCTAECDISTNQVCAHGDGCCPGGCEYFQDGDCPIPGSGANLCTIINNYRVANGLPTIPVSKALTAVAVAHTWDLHWNNPDAPAGCNLHSWSNNPPANVTWSDCCYTSDHAQAACMWNKPAEITNNWTMSYNSYGYEISASGTDDPATCLSLWQGSMSHNNVILNQDIWATHPWLAIGCSASLSSCSVWFGENTDQNPFP